MLRNTFKILDPDPEAGDFQNITSSSISKDTSLVKFSWRSDQEFFYSKLLADRHTGRKTDKRRVKHYFFGGGNDKAMFILDACLLL